MKQLESAECYLVELFMKFGSFKFFVIVAALRDTIIQSYIFLTEKFGPLRTSIVLNFTTLKS